MVTTLNTVEVLYALRQNDKTNKFMVTTPYVPHTWL